MSDDKQSFFVESPDGRKFKMVIRGDLGRLSVSKIRRYLGNYGVQEDCLLAYNGVLLEDAMVGEDFGLLNNTIIKIKYDDTDDVSGGGGGVQREDQQRQQPKAASGNAPLRPHDAWGQQQPPQKQSLHSPLSERMEEDLRAQLAQLQSEKAALEQQVRTLSSSSSHSTPAQPTTHAGEDPFEVATANLKVLSQDLQLPLRFDSNCTCVLNGEGRARVGLPSGNDNDGLSVFISYDAQTQRVVVYTTLLTQLPLDNPPLLTKLYEVLLEGSLLGREVCGGGIGIARDSELVVVQSSFSVLHTDTTLLRDLMPPFVETVLRWRGLINELMA